MEHPIPHLGNPADQSLREYIVSLKYMHDSLNFYDDMETPGGNLYIPDRVVECSKRKPISRNTHYMLTYDEAAEVRKDPRVLSVKLNPKDLGLEKELYGFVQTSNNFDKTVASDSNDINWALLRLARKVDIPNWGIDGDPAQSATVIYDASGKNVDVVVVDDGCPYPTLYEYAQNSNGTGYSRMVEYNWFQHDPVVKGTSATDFDYVANRLQEHGGHTTGNCAGNTQGFARDANIYNYLFANTDLNDVPDAFDYIREFHRNKPINPLTGVKNPTIVNNSWGYTLYWTQSVITAINFRGTFYSKPTFGWTDQQLGEFKLRPGVSMPVESDVDIDVIDAINDGIIIVASAGNSYWYCDVPGGPDYDNFVLYKYKGQDYAVYYNRGSSPGSAHGGTLATKAIVSGAIGQHNEAEGSDLFNGTGIEIGDYKAEFSNYGPLIDCYAPGSGVQSVWNVNESGLYDTIPAPDPRVALLGGTDLTNNNFKKCPGTSMSGPNTVGVLACFAEKYPTMTQLDAHNLLRSVCKETLLSTNGGSLDVKDAGLTYNTNSCKRILFFQGNRHPEQEVGGFYPTPFPTVNNWIRPITGQTYPRKKIVNRNQKPTFNLTTDKSSVLLGETTSITLTTTNVPDGTLVPYIITAKPFGEITTQSYDGIANVNDLVLNLDSRPNTGTRFTTTGDFTGTSTPIANQLLGPQALTQSTPDNPIVYFYGSSDDGYWEINLPWSFRFLNVLENSLYVGTNGYITFGAGSAEFQNFSNSNPPLQKICISANDNSCQRIFYGIEGAVPGRKFRIRYEGFNNFNGTTIGNSNIIWEMTLYESIDNQFDIQIGTNSRWFSVPYSFSYKDISIPLTGNLEINNNTASIPINILTDKQLDLNFRLGIFPAPNINISVN